MEGPSGRTTGTAVRNTTLPLGDGPDGKSLVFVKQGNMLAINIWGLYHDKEIWGDDVNEFEPERWISRKSLWEFVPFLGGPRICLANKQVFTQAAYLLVRMTRNLARIENPDEVNEYVERIKMTTESRNRIKAASFAARLLIKVYFYSRFSVWYIAFQCSLGFNNKYGTLSSFLQSDAQLSCRNSS